MEEASPEPETAGLAPTLTRTEEGGRRILTDEVAQQQVNADLEAQAKGRGAKITADIKKMREGPRISAKESERIAAGEGVAVALSSDPEDFNTPAGRKRFYDFAERMAEASEKAGTPLDPILAEVRTLRGKTRGGGAVQKAARARLVELRAAYAEQTTKQADAKREAGAVVRETEEEAKTRKQAEKLTAAANAMRDIVQELPLSKAAAAGSLKALEQHADAVIERAKASGANVLDLQTGAKLDPFLTYLANVRDLKRLLRGGQSGTASAEVQAVIRERVADFVNDDFLLRQGAGDELQARRAAQATKQGASYDENAATPQDEAREGTDQVEAYDEAVGVGDTTREEEDGPDAFKEDDDGWAGANPNAIVEDAPLKAASEEITDAVTAGKDRAGTFTAAKKGQRQKIASPTAPRAEAIKALIRTKMTSAAKPVEVNTSADLAAVRKDVDPAPTEAQKEAGNYAKAHVFYGGMKVAIETPKGGTRSGTDRNGTAWSVKLPADYGYIKQTTGADGAQLDVYLGPNPSSARVFVVDQKDVDTGKFDEHKALLGYDSQEDAVATYLAGFSDGRGAERMLGVTELTLGQFRLWSHGRYKLPVSSKGAELKAKLAAKTHAEMKATTDPVVAAENLKEMRAVENADVVDPPILPRKVWETIPYVEGEVHPFVLRKNKMREWANALTDEQYDALQRYYGQTSHGFNFPRYLGVGLEPERAIIEWQSFLDGKPGRGYSAEGEAAANRQIDAFERKMARVDDSATPASAALDGEDIVTNLNAMLRNADMSQFTGLHGAVVGRVQKRILALAGDVKVRIVSQARMMELYADEMERTGKPGIPSGFYDPARDEIVLREDKLDDDAEGTILALHEGVHAAFAAAMEKRPNLKRFVKGLLDTAQARFERENPGTKLPYGFTDEHEFLAEALSNREFVEFLANTPVGNVDRMRARTLAPGAESVWTKLLTKIKTVLGFHPGDTTLDFLLRAVHQLDNGATRDRIDGRKFGRFDRDALRDRAGSFDDAMRGVGLKLRTMHQIMQKYRGLFPTSKGDALEIIVEAVQRMSRTAKVYTQDGHEIAEKFMQLRRTNPKEADAAAKFMIDATQADFMPVDKANATQADLLKANHWLKPTHARHRQAVSQLVPMNNRFMALAPETRAYILQSAKYYADMQNMKAKEIVNVIIDNHNETAATAISDADRAMLIQHVVSGTLTEADKTLVGNDVTFNDLVTARGLRVRNGLYFPLMRHGNFVVRATAKLGNLYGGTLVPGIKGNNVIEWRAGDDKTARAMFEQFADDPESLDITSQGKVYYLKGTNTVVSAANAKGQDVDVAYRARVQRDATMMFDSSTQARKFIREAKARGEYEDGSIDDKPLPKADQGNPTDLGTQQFAGIISSIEKRTDISKETKAVMLATMQQAALRMMTGNRIQQRSLARRGVYGASEDMARNQIQYAQASGHYLAKIQHMGPIREALKDMRAMVGRDKDSADRSAVLGEIEKRINDPRTMDPDGSAQWVQDIMLLSYLDKLASPAYSVFNGMQPWMTTLPVLSGQHNPLVVGYEINRAYNAIASITAVAQGVMNTGTAIRGVGKISIDTRDVAGSIRKNLAKQGDGEDLLRLINTMTDRNMLDDGAGMEIAGAVGNGRGAWGTGLAKLDRAARQLPLAMEQINRSVSAVAAYRLAKSKGMSHEQAVNYALDIVQNTQGDYSSQNAPRIFNVPALRPALQFKKYAQMMSALLVDLVQKSFGPNSPKAERVAAMRSLMAIVTVQVAMAGALSLPGFELVKIVAMVGAALGLTDGWEEWERRMQGWAEEAMGKTPAELVTKGVLTRGLGFIPGMPPGGIDASTRLSLADMWTFGEPKGNDRDSIYAYLAQFMLGAPGSLGVDMLQGAKAFVDGDTTKGFINIIPNKFVSDVIKATTGPSSSNLTSPQVTSEQVAQALGFRSGRMVDKGEEIGDSINKSKRQEQRKKDLSRAYTNATSKSELIKIKAQIVAHNKTADMRHKVFITGLDNRRAATEKEKRAIRQ